MLVERFGLQDSWLAAEERLSPGWSTFPFFEEPTESPFRIDWILASSGVRVRDARIDDFRLDGDYPSDHMPVHATVDLPGAPS